MDRRANGGVDCERPHFSVHVLVRPLALSRGPSPFFLPRPPPPPPRAPAVPLLPYISVPERIDPSNTRLHRDAVLSCFISFY